MPIIGPVCCCCYSVVKDRQTPSGAAADCREELPNLLELITRVKLFFYLPLRLFSHQTINCSIASRSPRSLQARALKTAANYLIGLVASSRKDIGAAKFFDVLEERVIRVGENRAQTGVSKRITLRRGIAPGYQRSSWPVPDWRC